MPVGLPRSGRSPRASGNGPRARNTRPLPMDRHAAVTHYSVMLADGLPPLNPQMEISLATRGYSKGVAQTEGAQIVVRPSVPIGSLRLGAYAKNVSSTDYDGEVGVSAGVVREIRGFELSATATLKSLVNADITPDKRALELYAGASRPFGRADMRLSLTYSPNDLGGTEQTLFAESQLGYRISKKLKASAAIGWRTRHGGPDYIAFNAGATYQLVNGLAADLRWYGNDREGLGDLYEDRLVGSLRATF